MTITTSLDFYLTSQDDTAVTPEFMERLLEHYREQKKLHRRYAFQILIKVREYFSAQPTLVDVPVPAESKFTICGDIHGQVRCRFLCWFNFTSKSKVEMD